MPYNPGSAYPRKTIYTPPVSRPGFQGAVNAPDVSSQNTAGGGPFKIRGRGLFAGQAAGAQGAAGHPDAATGFEAMQRKGIVGDAASKYREQRGLKQNTHTNTPTQAVGDLGSELPKGKDGFNADDAGTVSTAQQQGQRKTSTHFNPTASQRTAAARQLADDMSDGVITGDTQGDTGTANTRKSKKGPGKGQGKLF